MQRRRQADYKAERGPSGPLPLSVEQALYKKPTTSLVTKLLRTCKKNEHPSLSARVLVLFLKLVQNIVVSDVQQQYDGVSVVLPYNSDVHIDAEFEQGCRSLYPLCPK